MQKKLFFKLYAISLPIFFVIDMIWLNVLAADMYEKQIGHLLGEVKIGAVFAFYALFLLGLTFFATVPSANIRSPKGAALLGGLFGFFTYITYDLTNYATIDSWPLAIVMIDIIWGTFIGAAVSCITVFFYCKTAT